MNNILDVIIDCDPGIDDALALIYAIKNPNWNVKGITIVSGNVCADKGVKNAQYILNLLDRKDIPIYWGGMSEVYVNAEDTHGYNGLGNYDYGSVNLDSLKGTDACDFLSIIHADILIALGPLTNLWCAYTKNPAMFNNYGDIIVMGGAFKTYGNCTPVSEYNFWCDPYSAKKFFEVVPSDKMTLVPLDVTRKIILTPEKVKDIEDKNFEVGNFIRKITAFYMHFHFQQEGIYGCVINDPLAIFVADGYLHTKSYYALVCDNMDITRGQMIVDAGNIYHKEPNCQIVTSIKADEVDLFWETFIKIICK